MHAVIQHLGADLLCRSPGASPSELRIDGDAAITALAAWAARYDAAVPINDQQELLAIGRELFAWLDTNGWASAWATAPGPRALELRIDGLDEPLSRALLDAPWELLARKDGFLADDAVQLFEVVRRIGAPAEPIGPRHGDLRLMFMAAAPEGVSVLDFEDEEAAILEATQRLPLHLVVEESGAAAFLKERLELDGPFEALHLSCHGDIDPRRGHVLALEDEAGGLALADAAAIAGVLGAPERTPLVFLSACRSAEQAGAEAAGNGDPDPDAIRRSEPFVRDLTRAGVANVLGWDGSVYDRDAMAFTQTFYQELGGYESVPRATARARLALRRAMQEDPRRGRHWHLARLYLGPQGGGALAARGRPRRRLAGAAHQQQFLDTLRSEVPVATRAEFVGRRRQAQAVLRAFRDDNAAGVLIHGMGNLGKSSLAARIASRLTGHKTVVVFRKYDALSVFDRLLDAVPAAQRPQVREVWRDAVSAEPAGLAALGEALEALLEGPLDADPVLLVVDDLEAILERPQPSETATPVQTRYRPALGAVLAAFAKARTASRLLVTSRYRFTLPDQRGEDLAAGLALVPLQPMASRDRVKQLRAAIREAGRETPSGSDPTPIEQLQIDQVLVDQALAVSGGNPGLQAALVRPIIEGETQAARQAIEAIEHYQQTGAPPEELRRLIAQGIAQDPDNAMLAFFQRMAFDTYRAALTPGQTRTLQAVCLFDAGLPVPRPALEAVAREAGVTGPAPALDRLLGLGLVDDWGLPGAVPHAAANPLARPLVDGLDPQSRAQLADAALPGLADAWSDADGRFPWDPRAVATARLALAARHPDPALINEAAEAAGRYLFKHENDAGRAHREVLQPSLDKLRSLGAAPTHGLLLVACDCAERLGDTQAQDQAVVLLVESDAEGADRAAAWLYLGRRDQARGSPDSAEQAFVKAADGFHEAGQVREWAVTRGELADILQARGELDEALRIRREEQLPVYEKLGDVRSRAVTLGRVADILQARGELDEALRIRREEQRPGYEKLGDRRSLLVGRANLAIGYLQRGQGDDREQANALLCLALDAARQLRIPEAQAIEGILNQVGFDCR